MDPTLFPTIGGTVGLLAVAGWLVISFMRENSSLRGARSEEVKDLKSDVKLLKAENAAQRAENVSCRLQVNGLIGFLQLSGVAVPDYLIRGHDATN